MLLLLLLNNVVVVLCQGERATLETMSRWQKTENGWEKSEAPLPEQKKPEAPNLAVPVAAEQAASLPEPQVSHASVR